MVKQKYLQPAHRKRHGFHQRRSHRFVKVYLPYLPLVVIVITGLLLSTIWQPKTGKGVLAYATSISTADLLSSTNQQRQANGKSTLSLNSQLNQAAQAKANDMTTRNYWSHNTPEGNEPWVFIDQAGYGYQQAGENLAYGFATSSDTVNGWMNSPSHKANLLDNTYKDVGFGFANSPNYQNTGPQTIVVAMYGNPQVAGATSPSPTPAPTPQPSPQPAVPPSSKPQPAPSPPVVTQTEAQSPPPSTPQPSQEEPKETAQPANSSNTPLVEPESVKVARIQTLTAGKAPWSLFAVGLLSGASIVYLVLKHGLLLRRVIVRGEQFILQHTLLDVTIVAFVALSIILTRSSGVIR